MPMQSLNKIGKKILQLEHVNEALTDGRDVQTDGLSNGSKGMWRCIKNSNQTQYVKKFIILKNFAHFVEAPSFALCT